MEPQEILELVLQPSLLHYTRPLKKEQPSNSIKKDNIACPTNSNQI